MIHNDMKSFFIKFSRKFLKFKNLKLENLKPRSQCIKMIFINDS